jgi:hypothetical protein
MPEAPVKSIDKYGGQKNTPPNAMHAQTQQDKYDIKEITGASTGPLQWAR